MSQTPQPDELFQWCAIASQATRAASPLLKDMASLPALGSQASCRRIKGQGRRAPAAAMSRLPVSLFIGLCSLTLLAPVTGAEKYLGHCDVVFECDSTLHGFTGNITNVPLTVVCETNSAGESLLNARIEISPRQLTTHHARRDANMYKMFQSDRFPKLIAVVTNAPLAAAQLSPASPPAGPGTLPVQLTFCGITKEVRVSTVNPQPQTGGWEFELQTDVSLKDFKLRPPSVLLGTISVRDQVKVKAHVKVHREIPQSQNRASKP